MRIRPKGRKTKQGNWFQHDFAFMCKVASEYISGDDSALEVAERYGISKAQVYGWARRYKNGKEPFNEVSLTIMPKLRPQQQNSQSDIEKQNEELLRKLEQANLKIAGLETMIDIAEDQLGVDIRKKSGAKQS